MTATVILTQTEIVYKIRRMAFQIYETNASEKEIVIAGIADNGFILAKRLKTWVEKIAPITVHLCEVTIDKEHPRAPIKTSLSASEYAEKSVVLVDDVLHSGTTLIYGVRHFLSEPLTQFKTAVLVDRNHKKYPIKADFKGISLSTSLNENIKVYLDGTNDRALLE
ncbi:phosphoribosyltransferase family protein [Altibacter sp. HG106]|nr:phosphoribosyltransferase family protein [Altibacter sp. HG106]MDC7996293.1 phosphoribosyltransferase family protein [Altibacter sp. HG106]